MILTSNCNFELCIVNLHNHCVVVHCCVFGMKFAYVYSQIISFMFNGKTERVCLHIEIRYHNFTKCHAFYSNIEATRKTVGLFYTINPHKIQNNVDTNHFDFFCFILKFSSHCIFNYVPLHN